MYRRIVEASWVLATNARPVWQNNFITLNYQGTSFPFEFIHQNDLENENVGLIYLNLAEKLRLEILMKSS